MILAAACDGSMTWSSGLGIGLVFFLGLAGLAILIRAMN